MDTKFWFVGQRCLLLTAWITAVVSTAHAQQFFGHYPAGSEGLKAATLPPPGFYFRDYNIFYAADRLKGGPADFELTVYANAPRFIWMTPHKVLGADFGFDLTLPFIYNDLEIASVGVKEQFFELGDLLVEPVILGWHGKQWDAGFAYGFWAPSGDFDLQHAARPGKGFWSHMLSIGGTYYPDEKKAWSLSVLNRYEIHMENSRLDITPGDTLTTEWGISRTVAKGVDLGVIGYWQQQTFRDHGAGASTLRDRVVGIGPEILAFVPKINWFVSARYAREFAAKDHPEGHLATLTLSKRF